VIEGMHRKMTLRFSELNPKRLTQEDGNEGWYPYYAGFSLRFASDVLREARLPHGALVADPWVGSGTTTVAAAMGGLRAFGADLNPFAIVVASARLVSADAARGLCSLANEVGAQSALPELSEDDALRDWLPEAAARRARSVVRAILSRFGVGRRWRTIPPEAAFLLLCLVRGVRDVAKLRRGTNPTWVAPGVLPDANGRAVVLRFKHWVLHLASQPDRSISTTDHELVVADARSLPLGDSTVDAVLASPPYCTRIDYAVTTRFELAVIGQMSTEYDLLRRQLMGTTTIRTPHMVAAAAHWPKTLRTTLHAVRTHSSHRSEGYYFRNMLQYFTDADTSIRELSRILVRGGAAYLVLQSSYYKEIAIDLPLLLAELAKVHGFNADIVLRTPVRRILTTMNSKSRQYLDGRNYSEAMVRLIK
jgi:hypothetical protein